MIFIRYENWRSFIKFYPISTLLIAANVIFFIVVALNGGTTDTITLVKFGALTNVEPFSDQNWRIIASMFLHAGFSHLLFNCFALIVFAPPMERLLGSLRYLMLYMASGILSNVITIGYYNRMDEVLLSVGASGAIYGIYGAFVYVAVFQKGLLDESSRKTLYALLIFGIIYSFIADNVNWVAHFAGLIGGFFTYGIIIRLFKRRI